MKKSGKTSPFGTDAALWQYVARDVAPLKDRDKLQPTVALPKTASLQSPASKPYARPVAHVRVQPARPPAPTPPLAAGAAPGLDRRTATRLRRGKLVIGGRLDLHGMILVEAERALGRFLTSAHGRGVRCVLVITGKGLRGNGTGVIRAALPGWLNGPSLRPIVVAFSQAQLADGGAGAFYVYLRRDRKR
jgi:DNA-nicking Smr family endonuclease